MRVTFILPIFDLSGGNRAVATYADRLHRRGHEVFLVGLPPTPLSLLRRLKDWVRGRGWQAQPKQGPSHCDSIEVPHHVLKRCRPVVDADVPDADVVIATWWETGEWVENLAPSKGVKVHFMQDYEIWGGPRDRVDATCRLPMPKILGAEWVGTLLRERFGVTDYTVIPYGVDMDLFHAPPRGKQLCPTVGLCYTAFRNKGTDISLKAVEIARQKVPDLRLVAFGGSPPRDDLPLPADCDYSLLVPNDRLRTIYARCDAWLFGTRIEGFGLPILEAMACRTPVIGTPAGAAPELIVQGGGYLVRPEDPEDMAAAIERLVSLSDTEWRAMSEAAYQTAARYTWDEATDLFEKALHAAVAGSAQSNPLVSSSLR
jgi:glycosyltransferase involved in cell wall biosynthesis